MEAKPSTKYPKNGIYQIDEQAFHWARRHHLQSLASEAPEQQAWAETLRYKATEKIAGYIRKARPADAARLKVALKQLLLGETHAEYWIENRGREMSRLRARMGRAGR